MAIAEELCGRKGQENVDKIRFRHGGVAQDSDDVKLKKPMFNARSPIVHYFKVQKILNFDA